MPSASSVQEREVLTAVGEAVYEWSIADDVVRWGENALEVLGLDSLDRISTGRAFDALLEPTNLSSRHDTVLNSTLKDAGEGVAYQVQYSITPDRQGAHNRLWIEDIGRWYAGADGKPIRAHGVLRVITERYEREQRLAFLSRSDELTGYFNRSHLLSTLDDAIVHANRHRSSIVFMVISIDGFRAINEAYGYETAEQVFAVAARRIKGHLRAADAIGRFSGGKLGIVLMDCEETEARVAAGRFLAAVRQEVIDIEAGSMAVTVSIGGVTLPRHGRTTAAAVARAQEALDAARHRGNGHFVAYVHSPAVVARRRQNADQSRELVAALNESRIRLAFQPVVDVDSRKPSFHEALARLEPAGEALVGVESFVAVAERLGLVRLVDRHVLELVLDALAAWPSAALSMNVSAETIGDSEWIEQLSRGLADRPDLARRLIVEITETVAISNVDEAVRFVATLHELGCRVAIDDFGAGFSSFRNLRLLNVDFFKIDGSFVKNLPRSPDDQIFVKALAELARSFKVTVVAEWVQDEETVALLAGWGIQCIQGHLTGLAGDAPGGVSSRDAAQDQVLSDSLSRRV